MFWRQKGVQSGTSKVYLIKWQWEHIIYFLNNMQLAVKSLILTLKSVFAFWILNFESLKN